MLNHGVNIMKPLLVAASLAAIGLGAHAEPLQQNRDVQTAALASTRGVDLSRPAERAALLARLARTAAELCDSRQPRNLAIVASDQACAEASYRRAAAVVGPAVRLAAGSQAPIGSSGDPGPRN
jgi:UrcA family protein